MARCVNGAYYGEIDPGVFGADYLSPDMSEERIEPAGVEELPGLSPEADLRGLSSMPSQLEITREPES